ncbi:MAG: hypothetical protein SXA11_26280 [Cyanobacteriota bacterium]|nr:hypothetical protein [Cyanobacteriota bacterium]
MAHLKTQSTPKNLEEREEEKWKLIKSLYERDYAELEVVNLFRFIDKMMTLNTELEEKLYAKVRQYEAERKTPFLSRMEEIAIEKTAKSTNNKSIINLLHKRFGELSETLVEKINKIDDISVLEKLILDTISVTSAEEFEGLIIGIENRTKSIQKKSITTLLETRFGELPETLVESVNKVDDISILDKLGLETMSVNSVEEFEELVNPNLREQN